jgi:hypothetical protein
MVPAPVEERGYKKVIKLPDWKSAKPDNRIREKQTRLHRKNTCNTVISGHGVPIRDIAVKSAIEK